MRSLRRRKRKTGIVFGALSACLIVIGIVGIQTVERRDVAPKDVTLQNVTPQDATPQNVTPQDVTSQNVTPQDEAEESGPPEPGSERDETGDQKAEEQWKKGYNLPIGDGEKKEAADECIKMMDLISDIYKSADKGEATNVILSDQTLFAMRDRIKQAGDPVCANVTYSSMKNHKQVDRFLKDCKNGKQSTVILYTVRSDGGIGRSKYIFDGTDMYQFDAGAVWDAHDQPEMGSMSLTRIKQWDYSEHGWFCYELCVPEYPEVSEMVDGSRLIRVKPMSRENRSMTRKVVAGLGYQGNNLLSSDWDRNHMQDLDYNGLYEYLYEMKFKKKFDDKKYADGIPKDLFETIIMEYLPIKAEQIRKYASYDKKSKTYDWVRLGYYNYTLSFFGTSVPEVIKTKKNKNGTYTLTIAAICEMVLNDDSLITHELTIEMGEDGSFKYLGNRIREEVLRDLPVYQYRVSRGKAGHGKAGHEKAGHGKG